MVLQTIILGVPSNSKEDADWWRTQYEGALGLTEAV